MSNELGKYLKELRGKHSLRDIAERTGLSHTYIGDIEKGKRRASDKKIQVSPDTLKKLAKAYGHSFNDLMEKAGYIDFTETVYDVNEPNYEDVIEGYPTEVKENSPSYIEKEYVDIARELKKLTDELDMDLRDPETLDTIKGALDLIKRAKGK